ncbi:MAG: hypothetical protein ACK5NC_05350 [Vibrio sp.]
MKTATLFLAYLNQAQDQGATMPTNEHDPENIKVLKQLVEGFCVECKLTQPKIMSHYWNSNTGEFRDIEIMFDDSMVIITKDKMTMRPLSNVITAYSLPETTQGGAA